MDRFAKVFAIGMVTAVAGLMLTMFGAMIYEAGEESGEQEAYYEILEGISTGSSGWARLKTYNNDEYFDGLEYMYEVALLECERYDENGVLEGECFDYEPQYVSKDSCISAESVYDSVTRANSWSGEYYIYKNDTEGVKCELITD